MQFKKLMDFSAAQLAGQRVFIRADFNVPQDDACKNEGIAHHAKMQVSGAAALSPSGTICAKCFSADATRTHKAIKDVGADDLIFDLGTDSAVALARTLQTAGTIVWNGSVSVFEFEAFSGGTSALAHAIANSPAYSIAEGGDTVAAINAFGIADQIDYISTAGGAFLEFLEGKTLPAIEVPKQRASL